MRVEEVELERIAESIGTPFYCYSAGAIEGAFARWREAFGVAGFAGSRHRTCFAVKANNALAVLRHLQLEAPASTSSRGASCIGCWRSAEIRRRWCSRVRGKAPRICAAP